MIYSTKLLVILTLILIRLLLVSTQDEADNFTLLVVGGYRPSEHTLVKHIVSLRRQNTSIPFGATHFCGGSILTSRIILTAAHCMWDPKEGHIIDHRSIEIVAKTPNRLKKSQQTEILGVQKIIVHPSFQPGLARNDVALMKLTSDIGEDGVYAQSISLPVGPVKSGQKCTAVGWGGLFFEGPLPSDALYVDLNILSYRICVKRFINFAKGMLCVGDLSDPEKDICQGDSGGPLICDGKVTGIVSFTAFCVGGYSVFTDVWYYRDWILRGGKGLHNINILTVLLMALLVWIVS